MSVATVLPIVALLYAATFWGSVWYPLRLLADAGLIGLWASGCMFIAVSVLGLGVAAVRWRVWRQQVCQHPYQIALFACVAGWMNIAFVLAVLDGPIVRVLLLFYLSPVWSTLLAWWWLQERPSRFGLTTLALAMLGAMIMLWDSQLGFPWPQSRADWLAITAGMAFSLTNVLVRRLRTLADSLKSVLSWWSAAVVATVWLLITQPVWPETSANAWLGASLLGIMGVSIATLATVYGVGRMPIHRSAVILLFELVAGAVSSQWLSNEILTTTEWLGGGLVVLAAYLSARALQKSQLP